MKKILLFWWAFFGLFLGSAMVIYGLNMAPTASAQAYNAWIGGSIILYLAFQVIAVRNWLKGDKSWIISGIIVQALFAVVSPLFYSNFGDPRAELITGQFLDPYDALTPCHLCWWARIMMFPILPLSIIYAIGRSRDILRYIYLITIPGILLESFHYLLQKPGIIGQTHIANPFGCTEANPCAALDVDYLGFITIPLLCLTAFIIIHILTSILIYSKKR